MSNFTVYRSSAGSGKTFTLVKEYLKLALSDTADPPQRYKHILAVTFTNKAAAEMKNRVLQALKELATPKQHEHSPMAKALSEELLLDPFTLSDRAQSTLRAILHNYTDFAIGTIDAFVHRIVRAFAFDLHLPVNFEVETDADKLLRDAVNLLVSRIGNDEQLTEVLVQFAESKAEEDRSWQIEQELLSTARHLLAEEGSANVEQLKHLNLNDFLLMRDRLRDSVDAFIKEVSNRAEKIIERIEAQNISSTAFYQGARGIPGWFKALSEGQFEKLAEPNRYVYETFENDKWHSSKASSADKSAIDSLKPLFIEAWKDLIALREKDYGQFIVHRLLLRNIYALAALNEIEKLIFSFRAEQNIVHISAFNRIISEIVFEEPVPFIYERLGERYENYLIDEFQDTSVLQWQNLLPLIDNALGNGNFTMLVGDGKQAIYRWRGGDVEQFARLPRLTAHTEKKLVAEREQSLTRNFIDRHLSRNFRSKAEIVEFNNTFFQLLTTSLDEEYRSIYDRLEQEYLASNTGGYVQIECITGEREQEVQLHLEKTITQIQNLIAEGWDLQDIAVLTRTNREGNRIASALLEAGFPVISSESLLIHQSTKVRFLLAVLRSIEHTGDAIAATEMIQFLVQNEQLSKTLHNLLIDLQTKDLEKILAEGNFAYDPIQLGKMPLYQRCEEIIRNFKLDTETDAYLLFFLDEVLSYGMNRGNDPSDFLDWWNERRHKAAVVVSEGMNAVRVMTIHKAKGLEFPIVIFPFANWKFDTSRKDLWVDLDDDLLPGLNTAVLPVSKDLAHTIYALQYKEERNKSLLDHLNVLYVALTRPEQRLYVFTGVSTQTSASDLSSASDCFAYFLTVQEHTDRDQIWTTANVPAMRSRTKSSTLFIHPEKLQSTDWTNHIRIRSHASEFWDKEIDDQSQKDIYLLRAFFKFCPSRSDTDRAMQLLVNNGYAGATHAFLICQKAIAIMDKPELKHFFSPDLRVQTEAQLLHNNGEIRKFDRVVWLPDQSIVKMQLKHDATFEIIVN